MVQNFKTQIKIIVIIFVVFSCSVSERDKQNTSDIAKISGLWYTILPDSTYSEVYFTDSLYCVYYSEVLNLFKYKITKDDSMQILDEMFINKFKVQVNDSSNLVISSVTGSSQYFKINNQFFSNDEWKRFIEGETEVREKYREYFLAREYDALLRIGKQP